MSERQFHLKFGGSAAASVDAYLEYKRYETGGEHVKYGTKRLSDNE